VTVFDAKRLRASLGGARVVLPGDRQYGTARRVWNGRIDRHPAAVVFARDVQDVRATVTLARDGGARLFVRGGGHSVAGLAVGEGVVLDVSGLRDIEVDPVAGTARVGSGLRLGDVDRATQRFGLTVPLGTDSEVGLAGLTLGGGNEWLMGAHGATVDSLLSVELVCADGTMRLASADVEPDLFWALRRGGGNFGVATAFEFRLHPVGPEVVGGMIAYPWKSGFDALRLFRELVARAPDELTAFACLLHLDGEPVVAIALCWGGPTRDAERVLAPLYRLRPVSDQLSVTPFVALQTSMDAARPFGRQSAMRSHYMAQLSDAAIEAFIACFAESPSPLSVAIIEHCHGAIARVAPTATAFAPRRFPFHVEHIAFWSGTEAEASRNLSWVQACYAETSRFGTSAVYVNSLDAGEEHRVADAYGPNYERLRALKAIHDPDNVFSANHNIRPLSAIARGRDATARTW
jgi:FAD/FMN-containing dehydrogenase